MVSLSTQIANCSSGMLTRGIRMGLVAAIFMALNTYLGWWYQRLVRHRFQRAVKAMYVPTGDTIQPRQRLPSGKSAKDRRHGGGTGSESDIPLLELNIGRAFTGGLNEHGEYELGDIGDGKRNSGKEKEEEGGGKAIGSVSFANVNFGRKARDGAVASGSRRGSEQIGLGGIVKRNTGGFGAGGDGA